MPVYLSSNERLCGQRHDQTPSLVRFLCGLQEMNTRQVFEQNLQIDKLEFGVMMPGKEFCELTENII